MIFDLLVGAAAGTDSKARHDMTIIDYLLPNKIPEALIRAANERDSKHHDKPSTQTASNPTTAQSREEH